MEIISSSKFKSFCDEHEIRSPVKEIGVGRYPSFEPESLRTINIHIVQEDVPEYLFELLKIILKSELEWILAPKYRFVVNPVNTKELKDDDAIIFKEDEQKGLCEYLSNLINNIRCVTDDLFLVSKSGNIIIRYDHHVISEGLSIELNDVSVTGTLLQKLNHFGAELELYYLQG